MHKVHRAGVYRDMSRAERRYCSGGGVQPDKMHVDVAVVAESSGNGKAGGKGATERVDEHVNLLAVVPGKLAVNGRAVEVGASDIAFERDIVSGLCH